MNIVILSGRLVKDFELKGNVARSSIAVDKATEGANFIDLVAFNKTAEICAKYGRKGMQVVIEGNWNTFKTKEGKSVSNCAINSIHCMGKGEKKTDEVIANNAEELEEEEEFDDSVDMPDDDLPF